MSAKDGRGMRTRGYTRNSKRNGTKQSRVALKRIGKLAPKRELSPR